MPKSDKSNEEKLAAELKKVDKAVAPKNGLTKILAKATGKQQGKAGEK